MKNISWITKVIARKQTQEFFNCNLGCLKYSRNNISWQAMMKGHFRQPFCDHTWLPCSSGHTGEAWQTVHAALAEATAFWLTLVLSISPFLSGQDTPLLCLTEYSISIYMQERNPPLLDAFDLIGIFTAVQRHTQLSTCSYCRDEKIPGLLETAGCDKHSALLWNSTEASGWNEQRLGPLQHKKGHFGTALGARILVADSSAFTCQPVWRVWEQPWQHWYHTADCLHGSQKLCPYCCPWWDPGWKLAEWQGGCSGWSLARGSVPEEPPQAQILGAALRVLAGTGWW